MLRSAQHKHDTYRLTDKQSLSQGEISLGIGIPHITSRHPDHGALGLHGQIHSISDLHPRCFRVILVVEPLETAKQQPYLFTFAGGLDRGIEHLIHFKRGYDPGQISFSDRSGIKETKTALHSDIPNHHRHHSAESHASASTVGAVGFLSCDVAVGGPRPESRAVSAPARFGPCISSGIVTHT